MPFCCNVLLNKRVRLYRGIDGKNISGWLGWLTTGKMIIMYGYDVMIWRKKGLELMCPFRKTEKGQISTVPPEPRFYFAKKLRKKGGVALKYSQVWIGLNKLGKG